MQAILPFRSYQLRQCCFFFSIGFEAIECDLYLRYDFLTCTSVWQFPLISIPFCYLYLIRITSKQIIWFLQDRYNRTRLPHTTCHIFSSFLNGFVGSHLIASISAEKYFGGSGRAYQANAILFSDRKSTRLNS